MATFDQQSLTFDASLLLVGGADLCTFDSEITSFDSTVRTFDATTCGAGPSPTPGGTTPAGEPISNWQAHHRRIWRHRTKRELEEIIAAERIALGIIPAPIVEHAIKAAQKVDARIEEVIEQAPVEDRSGITEQVAREYIAAQIIIQEFKSELAAYRKSRNRRAAVLLLVH